MEGAAENSFERVLAYILERTGIRLPETKHRAVREYLAELGEGIAYADFKRYVEGTGSKAFMDAVTINETYFFREQRHFSLLASELFSLRKKAGAPLRIWSAACSTGEEALSLAALAESLYGPEGARVYASDISPQVLARFKAGTYGTLSLREDGKEFHRLLDRHIIRTGNGISIQPEFLSRIEISCVNLADARYPEIPDNLDLVFLRNVLMYMPLETRQRIVGYVSEKLAEGGYLFVSSSEIPHLAHPELALEERNGCFLFRKKRQDEKRKGIQVTGDSFRPRSTIADPSPATIPEPRLVPELVPQSRKAGVALSVDAIAGHASLRLNNPLYADPEDPAFPAALHFLEAVYRLNAGKLDALETFIRQGESAWGSTALSAYLLGMLAAAGGDTQAARACLRESITGDERFWPARLHLALLLKDTEAAEAAGEFSACSASIQGYIARNDYRYQFLLEGFNAKYFLDLCGGWIRKLQSGGAAHGS